MYVGESSYSPHEPVHHDRGPSLRHRARILLVSLTILLAGCASQTSNVELDKGPVFQPIPITEIDPMITSVFQACVADQSLSPGVEDIVGDALETVSAAMETGHIAANIVDNGTTPSVEMIQPFPQVFLNVPNPDSSQAIATTAHEITHAARVVNELKNGVTFEEMNVASEAQYELEEPMGDFILQDMAACAERQGVPRNQNEDAWYFSTFGYKPIEVQRAFVGTGATPSSPTYAAMFWMGMGLGREHKLQEVEDELWQITQQLQKNPYDGSLLAKKDQYASWGSSLAARATRDWTYATAAYTRATPEEQAQFQQILKEQEALFSSAYLRRAAQLIGGK